FTIFGIILFGVILGFYRNLELIGYSLITLSYFVITMVFAYFWFPIRKPRTATWDIALSYIILISALIGRWVLADFGFWFF
ncbi:MAG: hypothetical protein ACFFD8_05205, partial [Candidatus Thorarchaeota archaeon]